MDHLSSALGNSTIKGLFTLKEGEVLDSTWKNVVFTDATISGGSLTGSVFEKCTFKNVVFDTVYLDDVDFIQCQFENVSIQNCTHEGMEMRDCIGPPPTIMGTKEKIAGWENLPIPPAWNS
jgi:uncharacterized protein YjbI with pentapeptide repeats